MSDYKKRVMDAMIRHHEKDAKEIDKLQGRGKKNKAPEKDVERECLLWMRSVGWIVEIYEAKASYDPKTGIYRSMGMKAGTLDCMGVLPSGISVAVEFKARGKLATFNRDGNERQREFATARINANCFCCVVDSVDMLSSIFIKWEQLRLVDVVAARDYLLDCLP